MLPVACTRGYCLGRTSAISIPTGQLTLAGSIGSEVVFTPLSLISSFLPRGGYLFLLLHPKDLANQDPVQWADSSATLEETHLLAPVWLKDSPDPSSLLPIRLNRLRLDIGSFFAYPRPARWDPHKGP
ncbi:hypothetical protein NDU88_011900 [Pleurodeles waltl]|uniref:Uncharacterized protein n=1 Tax=Pleurodeles waltl TaxID=8319 RepID=A0AAV7R0H4_PLEWA|nr:hypothetical protein NDU88_011900 [Pleurodeles waltl]